MIISVTSNPIEAAATEQVWAVVSVLLMVLLAVVAWKLLGMLGRAIARRVG